MYQATAWDYVEEDEKPFTNNYNHRKKHIEKSLLRHTPADITYARKNKKEPKQVHNYYLSDTPTSFEPSEITNLTPTKKQSSFQDMSKMLE